jgi:PIN domain nuclease of toxin-antitoxin system
VTILDAYAVIAYLRSEPAAEQVRPLLKAGDGALTAVGLAEVVDHLVRLAGADEDDTVLDLAQLGLLDAVPVDAPEGSARDSRCACRSGLRAVATRQQRHG